MVIQALLRESVFRLKEGNIENAIFEAHLILRNVLSLSPLDLVLMKDKAVSAEASDRVFSIIRRRIGREPLQYILGTQEFMSLEFKVSPNVLIPRPDTECLVEYVLGKYSGRGMSALDIGTGSGCIAISLAAYNKSAYVRGIDISESALEIAAENARRNNTDSRVCFERCDILKEVPVGQYDVIVSNPPYIETDGISRLDETVKDYEPVCALDGGSDGLMFYRRIIGIAPRLLNGRGIIVFEVGHTQADAVSDILSENFENIEIIKDLCGIRRVVGARIRS